MTRARLTPGSVVAAAAQYADEVGIEALTLTALAERLDVKAPALYKHVDGLDDLRHRIATLAMTELSDALRGALQGVAGEAALAALFLTVRSYAREHPGRFAATTGEAFRADDDPMREAGVRVMSSFRAVIASYGVRPDEVDHAVRMLRCTIYGYVELELADGFQWDNDPEATAAWITRFVDVGLRAL